MATALGIFLLLIGIVFEVGKRVGPPPSAEARKNLQLHMSSLGWLWMTLGVLLIVAEIVT